MSNASDFIIEDGVLISYHDNYGQGWDVVIPEGVTSIGRRAFQYNTSLTRISLPESLSSIGDEAFYNCRNLTSITIPDSVTSIGNQAFYGCEGLADAKGFVIVKGVLYSYHGEGEDIVIPNGVNTIGERAFLNNERLTSVTLPSDVRSIGEYAFSICSNLSKIHISDGLISICKGAFDRCGKLTRIMLPKSIRRIEADAFPSSWAGKTCSLKEIIVDPENTSYRSIDGVLYSRDLSTLIAYPANAPATSFFVPEAVREIGDYAFNGCINLEEVVLPDTVERIGESAFYECTNLSSINLRRVREIGKKAFYECTELCKAELDSIRVIPKEAFFLCFKLRDVKFGNVESIGDSAFRECRISDLQLPDTLKHIGEAALFGDCGMVEIPKSVEDVGHNNFAGARVIILYDSLRKKIDLMGSYYNSAERSSLMFVRSASDGSLKYVVPLHSDGTQKMHLCLQEAWKEDNSFDFKSLDQRFKEVKSPDAKARLAATRLLNPVDLSDEAKKNYASYFSRNAVGIVKQLIDNKKDCSLIWLIEALSPYVRQSTFDLLDCWGLLKKTNIDELIEYAQKAGKTEWIAFLMNWKDRNIGSGKMVPAFRPQTYDVGDTIIFGQYTFNGKTVPSEWFIADTTKKQYLLVSKYLVKKMPFYAKKTAKFKYIGWSASDVRAWLNGEFYLTAFDDVEKNRICPKTLKNVNDVDTEDFIFILSEREYDKYIYSKDHAEKGIMQFVYGSKAAWYECSEMIRKSWLKGSKTCVEVKEFMIDANNQVSYCGSKTRDIASDYYVRPVMWISKE